MDRAFSSGSSASPPAAPANPSVGYATSGNPGTGTPATKPGAYWYHMVTEEMRQAISESGLAPSQLDLAQLAKAISTQSTDAATRYRSAATAGCACLIQI